MAMTTADGTKIGQNIVQDVNANVPSPNQPGQRVVSPEAALLFSKSLVAKPLMAPEVCSLRVKNTEYKYRWVNKLAQHGQFYNMRRSQGFVNATDADVDVLAGDTVADGGSITAGDLILMKIRADLYDGAILYNMKRSLAHQNARGLFIEGGSPDVNSDASPTRQSVAQAPYNRGGLATPFIPDNPDALVEDSIRSGRADKTRRQTEDMRSGGKA